MNKSLQDLSQFNLLSHFLSNTASSINQTQGDVNMLPQNFYAYKNNCDVADPTIPQTEVEYPDKGAKILITNENQLITS